MYEQIGGIFKLRRGALNIWNTNGLIAGPSFLFTSGWNFFFEKLPKLHLRLIDVNIRYLIEILGCHQIDLYRLMMLNNFNYAPELAEWIILKALHSTILSYDYVKFGKKLIRQ